MYQVKYIHRLNLHMENNPCEVTFIFITRKRSQVSSIKFRNKYLSLGNVVYSEKNGLKCKTGRVGVWASNLYFSSWCAQSLCIKLFPGNAHLSSAPTSKLSFTLRLYAKQLLSVKIIIPWGDQNELYTLNQTGTRTVGNGRNIVVSQSL